MIAPHAPSDAIEISAGNPEAGWPNNGWRRRAYTAAAPITHASRHSQVVLMHRTRNRCLADTRR